MTVRKIVGHALDSEGTKGPFANFVAEVEKIAPDRRVWVLMEIMGAQTRVAVGADQLRSV